MNTEKLLDICRHRAFTQTEYQNKNFVINSQLTPLKKVRQCIMEISMREEAVREKDQSLRKLKWKMQERQEAIDAEKSIPKKEMMKIEFEKFDYEYIKYKHQYDMAKKDLDNFVEIMQNLIKEYDIDLENIDIDNEEEDRKYWLIRMAKNCAVDIISTGRITTANLNAVLDMNEEDYKEVLLLAHKYSNFISMEINKSSEIAMSSIRNELMSNDNINKKLLDFYEEDNL